MPAQAREERGTSAGRLSRRRRVPLPTGGRWRVQVLLPRLGTTKDPQSAQSDSCHRRVLLTWRPQGCPGSIASGLPPSLFAPPLIPNDRGGERSRPPAGSSPRRGAAAPLTSNVNLCASGSLWCGGSSRPWRCSRSRSRSSRCWTRLSGLATFICGDLALVSSLPADNLSASDLPPVLLTFSSSGAPRLLTAGLGLLCLFCAPALWVYPSSAETSGGASVAGTRNWPRLPSALNTAISSRRWWAPSPPRGGERSLGPGPPAHRSWASLPLGGG